MCSSFQAQPAMTRQFCCSRRTRAAFSSARPSMRRFPLRRSSTNLMRPPCRKAARSPNSRAQFPGIRRLTLENHLRYTFVRFGVPYVVTMMCTEGGRHERRLSCRDADKVGIQFLKTLNIVGGAPAHEPAQISRADNRAAGKGLAGLSPITRPATFFPAPACTARPAAAIRRCSPRSAFPWRRRRPT